MARQDVMPGNLPLAGTCVMVTRSQEDADTSASRLEALGATVVRLPLIAIQTVPDLSPLDRALEHLSLYGWMVFTSRNAVNAACHRLVALDLLPLPSPVRVAAVGPMTAAALKRWAVATHCVPEDATGAALAACLVRLGIQGARILLPVGDRARTEVREVLTAAGAQVDEIVVYRTARPPTTNSESLEMLRRGKIDVVALASPSAVQNLVGLLESNISLLESSRLVCIGPTTAQAVQSFGLQPAVVASTHTLDGLIEAIIAASTVEDNHEQP